MEQWLHLEQGYGWFILALALGIGEVLAPGVFLIWIAMAAALTGLAALAIDLSVALQLLLFAVLCLATVTGGRRWYRDNPVASQDPLLNDRTARLIGETLTLAEPIEHGRGRVRVGDTLWSCKGPDAPAGAQVHVTGAEGAILLVALADVA